MPESSAIDQLTFVLCPMRIERTAIHRELARASLGHIPVIQTGIGKDAICRAVRRMAQEGSARPLLILAGAAGGLTHLAHDVPPIARVIDEHGHSWTPHAAASDGLVLIAVDRIVSTPEDKQRLAESTGASIVDMESHAFAALCEELRFPWSVVRAVSDMPDETLPHEVLGWITPEGDTNNLRAVRDMILKPSLLPHIITVLRRSNRVLPEAGRAVAKLIRMYAQSMD